MTADELLSGFIRSQVIELATGGFGLSVEAADQIYAYLGITVTRP